MWTIAGDIASAYSGLDRRKRRPALRLLNYLIADWCVSSILACYWSVLRAIQIAIKRSTLSAKLIFGRPTVWGEKSEVKEVE